MPNTLITIDDTPTFERGLAARGAMPHDASLGLFAEGSVAETCSTPGTAAFRRLALDENSCARRRDALHHGLLEPTPDNSNNLPPAALARAVAARSSRGMTLIEILVVLAIIGLIMGGVAIVAFNAFDDAKTKTAAKDIGTLAQSVEMYRLQKNKCPKTAQDLKAAGIIQKITKDPWGGDYVIKCPGEHGPSDISSAGKDGDISTEEDNINSWDENIGETPDEES